MQLFWRIRYLDSRDRQFKNRDLWLNTVDLDDSVRAAVEVCVELKDLGQRHRILRFRKFFIEGTLSTEEVLRRYPGPLMLRTIFVPEYFENENGVELTAQERAVILTGNPDAVAIPSAATKHDIDYILGPKPQVEVDRIIFSSDDCTVLSYFVRDLHLLYASAFLKDDPGALTTRGVSSGYRLETAVTADEVCSFVTIFRRLHTTERQDPATLEKAVIIFQHALGDHPLAKWTTGAWSEYRQKMDQIINPFPVKTSDEWNVTRKRLIDVFMYTQILHQANPKRTRQFEECLRLVEGKLPSLRYLFLTELWQSSWEVICIGKVIAGVYGRYCEHHNVHINVISSLAEDNDGLGILEKKANAQTRVMNERTEQLAQDLWRKRGSPIGGHAPFMVEARRQLVGILAATDELKPTT